MWKFKSSIFKTDNGTKKILAQIKDKTLLKCYKMAVGFLHCLKVLQWTESKKIVFYVSKLKILELSESYLVNFCRGSFEEIPLMQSCREFNEISFEIRLKSL